MNVHANTTPEQRLAIERKEFGEYGGVNASVEVSTTFTGANQWLRWLLPTDVLTTLSMRSVDKTSLRIRVHNACKLLCKGFSYALGPSKHAYERFSAAVMTAATMPAIFTGDVGPDKGGHIDCSGTKH
jgi:hypothetical protein